MKRYSELKDLELISQTALESSLAGFWDWDIPNNLEYLSPRFKEMFGYEDHEMENTPEAWQKIAFQEDLPKMFDAFNSHVASFGETPFKSIMRYHHKNGNTVWVKCSGKVVSWSEDKKPLRVVGCHIDITEEKELELELKKAIAEKDVLLSEVHHRVKNNLQLILSLARLKQKDNKLDIVEVEDAIRAISKAHEGIYRSERFDKIDLEKYVKRVIKPLLWEQDISLEIKADQISQEINFLIPIGLIMTECVNNSVKHAFVKDKEKKVVVELRKSANEIEITYKDNGLGYDSNMLLEIDFQDSFGVMLMISLANQIDGNIKFENNNGAQMKLIIDTPAKVA